MSQFLSVIICTYNREIYLRESLNCIAEQNLAKEFYELVVVNNNSSDSTDSICKKFKKDHSDLNFKYIIEKKPGLSFARNKGVEEADGDIIIFLDDDAMASDSYLSNISQFLSNNGEIIAGGGKIIPEYETQRPDWMSSYLLPLVASLDLGNKIRIFPKNKYPIGANMFFRKKFFESYGYFKTDLGRKGNILMGGEEKDIFQRIRQHPNSIVYLPDAIVRHIVPEKRLQLDYIINNATGIGISERIRIENLKASLFIMYMKEAYKWAGSIVLFLLFLLKFEYPKGSMIIRFRYFVTRGMLLRKRYGSEDSSLFR